MLLQIGHRGAAGLAPENTLSGMGIALKRGVDMIELDIQTCKTGEIVCHHDMLINRMSNGWGSVKNLELPQLKQLRFKGEEIPLLNEALSFVRNRVPLNVDIKDEGTSAVLVKELARASQRVRDNMLVSSRLKREVLTIKRAFPEIPVGLTTLGWNPFALSWAARNGLSFVNVPSGYLRRPFVWAAQKRGLQVYAFPYGHRRKLNPSRLRRMGVDGAMYNYPGVNPF